MSLARRLLWRLPELLTRRMEGYIITGGLDTCDETVKADDLLDTVGS
jgi:hypothetical protein